MAHTVMVTGADGFIGSHLTEELVKKGFALGVLNLEDVRKRVREWTENRKKAVGAPETREPR